MHNAKENVGRGESPRLFTKTVPYRQLARSTEHHSKHRLTKHPKKRFFSRVVGRRPEVVAERPGASAPASGRLRRPWPALRPAGFSRSAWPRVGGRFGGSPPEIFFIFERERATVTHKESSHPHSPTKTHLFSRKNNTGRIVPVVRSAPSFFRVPAG